MQSQRWCILAQVEAERNIIVSEELCRDHGHFLSKREKCYTMFVLYLADIIDKRKALYYADMSGTFHITREDLRTTILDGEEGVKACQSYMMSLIHTAARRHQSMISKQIFHTKKLLKPIPLQLIFLNDCFQMIMLVFMLLIYPITTVI